MVWASSPFARHYLGIRCFFLFLRLLRCFSSPGSLRMTMDSSYGDRSSFCRVSPFGYLRINGYLLLPAAFRSLPRPSSPDSSQASAANLFLLDHILFPAPKASNRFSAQTFFPSLYFQRACVPCRYALTSVLFLNLGQNRVELLTPALSERCSNQLSYCPVFDNSRTARGHRERKKADAV